MTSVNKAQMSSKINCVKVVSILLPISKLTYSSFKSAIVILCANSKLHQLPLLKRKNGSFMSQRIIFAGTPDFAAEHLQALLDAGFNIVAVYTQPDRPAGRGHKLTPSPVKQLAEKYQIEVRTPINFKDPADIQAFADLNADLAIVVAYGLILPQPILDAPRLGCINVHASLLPQWRGAAPIQRALLSGNNITGVTIMQIVKQLDAGDMLCQQTLEILPEDTSGSLFERLSKVGAECLVKNLPQILNGQITPIPQDPDKVTYAAKLTKEESPINFMDDAKHIDLQVRGLNPWPTATASFENTTYKIFAGRSFTIKEAAKALDLPEQSIDDIDPKTILGITNDGIMIKCGHDVYAISRLQAPGKGQVSAADFARSKKDVFVRGKTFE